MVPIAKIDAHHHLWTIGSDHYPLLSAPASDRYFGNTAGLRHEFGPTEFMALAWSQNVVKSVYVESMFQPPLAESRFVQSWSDQYGFPHAIIGRADLTSPFLGRDLDTHMESSGFRGLRLTVNWDEDPLYRSVPDRTLLRDAAWRRGYSELGQRQLIAEVLALPSQLLDLADVAAAFPETPLVLNHTGMPLRRTDADQRAWRRGMEALANLDHVCVKISGLGMLDHHWTTQSIWPVVDETIELFGAGRCLFGSNYPVDGLHADYGKIWSAFEAITARRPTEDRAALFHDNAQRIYRLA